MKPKSVLFYAATVLLFLLPGTSALAQEVEMADALTANGKIYVVVAVLLIILIGVFAYLIVLDRKLRRIENKD